MTHTVMTAIAAYAPLFLLILALERRHLSPRQEARVREIVREEAEARDKRLVDYANLVRSFAAERRDGGGISLTAANPAAPQPGSRPHDS